MELPQELLNEYNINMDSQLTDEEKVLYKESTYTVISLVAYLTGVPKYIFEESHYPPKMDTYQKLDKDKNCRIIRNLCMLRNALEKNYKSIYQAMSFDIKNLSGLSEYIPQEALAQLSKDGISIQKANCRPAQYIIDINKYISDRINNCKSVFPIWIKWEYIKDLFVMPNGTKEDGIKKAAMEYYSNLGAYPYQVYINWGYVDAGNILFNDKKFVTLLYEKHMDSFGDTSKITDAGLATKEGIYKFLRESDRVCIMVDCENSDPYKLYATLKNLDQEMLLDKIDKIILYDDVHTSSAWKILEDFTGLTVRYELIERLKEDKSLVDEKLTIGTCREHYETGTNSFIIVSSDSDYWALIHSFPDIRFLVMAEWEKCGSDIREALEVKGITYCFIDDFCTGNSEEMKTTAMLKALKKRLEEKISFSIKDLLEECYYETRADYSDAEKKQFYEKYVKKMQLVIDNDGFVKVELGK